MITQRLNFDFANQTNITESASNFFTLQKYLTNNHEVLNVEGNYPEFTVNLNSSRTEARNLKERMITIIDDYLVYNYTARVLNVTLPLVIDLEKQKSTIEYLKSYDKRLENIIDTELGQPELKLLLMINEERRFDFEFERSCVDMTSFVDNFNVYQEFTHPIIITYILFKYFNSDNRFSYTISPRMARYMRYLREGNIKLKNTSFSREIFDTANVSIAYISGLRLISVLSQFICFTNMSEEYLKHDKIIRLLSLLHR